MNENKIKTEIRRNYEFIKISRDIRTITKIEKDTFYKYCYHFIEQNYNINDIFYMFVCFINITFPMYYAYHRDSALINSEMLPDDTITLALLEQFQLKLALENFWSSKKIPSRDFFRFIIFFFFLLLFLLEFFLKHFLQVFKHE